MDSSRHLAAILFTDIVGYTSMMQQNEVLAVAVIKHYNAVLEKTLATHHGDLLNNYGDGTLCAFRSTAEAVNCAIEMQQQLQDEPKVPLRIGLHVGEIFFEDGKVLGDGVNVASRIESLGQANTILFSHEIHDKIKNHPEFKSVSLGLFEFKNVEKPVEVFALANEGIEIPKKEQMEGKLKKEKVTKRHKIGVRVTIGLVGILLAAAGIFLFQNSNRPKFSGKEKSIAVLPFENISGDKNNEYLSDGFTEEITTQLSKIRDLKVKARTSAKHYKNSNKTIREIAKDLGVEAILKGSVQKSGNAIRITAQLIDANTEEHIWADKYDRSIEEIFTIQSEVALQIAQQLNARLSVDEKNRIERKPTNNIAAYEDYLRGKKKFYDFFSPGNYADKINEAEKYFENALEKDSTFPLAWAGLALVYFQRRNYDFDRYQYFINKAMKAAIKGISYGPELSETHLVFGDILKFMTLDPTLSLPILQRAIYLDPSNAEAYCVLAFALMEIGRFNDAETNLLMAKKLDPQSQLMQIAWASYYNNSGNVEKAEGFIKEFSQTSFTESFKQGHKMAIASLRGQYDSLLAYSKRVSSVENMGIAYAKLGQVKNAMKMIDILKARSENNYALDIGCIYAWLHEKEKAMDYLDRAYGFRNPSLLNIKVSSIFDPLRNEKRFKELLKRMGLE